MSTRYKGSIMSSTAATTTSSAALGIWRSNEIMQAQSAVNWPTDPTLADTYFKYNSLLVSGNGTNNANNNTVLDSSTNAFAVTRFGNIAQGTFSPYGANWSNYFATNAVYFNVPSNAAFAFPGEFTVEGWFNWSTLPTAGQSTGVLAAGGFNFLHGSGSVSLFQFGGSSIVTATYTFVVGIWYHIAMTRNVSNTCTIWINGVSIATATSAVSFAQGAWSVCPTGGNGAGYASNLRVVKGVAVYTAAFTVPTAPLAAAQSSGTNIAAVTSTQTSLLTCQSNRFKDNSINIFTITKYGDPSVQRFSPFNPSNPGYTPAVYGGSGYFDGSASPLQDYLSIQPNTAFAFGTGDFTIEAWVYLTVSSGTRLMCVRYPGGGIAGSWGFNLTSTTMGFSEIVVGEPGPTATFTTILNTWAHVAAVRNAGVTALYLNGVQVASASQTTNFNNTTYQLHIGASDGNTGNYITGYVSNVRIIKGTAVYASAFTPPTAPVTGITNTGLLLNMTNASIIDNSMINNLETVGQTIISTTQSKFGGSSMYFDGTTDALFQPSNLSYGYGTGDFTIEVWLYLNATTTQTIVSNITSSSGASVAPLIYYASASGLRYYVSSADRITGSALSTGTWHHIAVSRSGSSTKMFINGTQTGSTYTDTNNYGTSNPLGVGDFAVPLTAQATLNGYIDDLRITKGYARYTANFTPPTSAFPIF